jgi:hypothetical protein
MAYKVIPFRQFRLSSNPVSDQVPCGKLKADALPSPQIKRARPAPAKAMLYQGIFLPFSSLFYHRFFHFHEKA